jgi:two-component system sensor histidine kinase ComP
VVLLQEQEAFVIQVEDAGQGFVMPVDGSNTAANSGLGLASVRRRLQLLRGRLTIDSVPGVGTCVTVAVPLAMFATSPSAA